MNLVVDIDGTLLNCEIDNGEYINAEPIREEIDRLNELYDEGYTILLWTGRHWNQYKRTKDQLKIFKIKYHELIMGKPLGIYIDADAKRSLKDI